MNNMLHHNEKYKILTFFFTTLIILFMIFLFNFSRNPNGNQSEVFFQRTNDYMADYYNVANASADGNPYLNGFNGSYFPLSYVIFHFLSKFAPYLNSDAFSAGKTNMGLATSAYFMFFISLIFLLALFNESTENKANKFLMTLAFLFSGIFIFSYERGNLIILSAFFLTIFLFHFESQNKITKELAFVSLALSASLKIYPALIGIILIYQKRYKEAVRLMIYGIIFAFLPFIFLKGGFGNVVRLFQNARGTNVLYQYMNYPRLGHYYFVSLWANSWTLSNMIPKEIIYNITSIIIYVAVFVGLVIDAKIDILWKQLGFLVCILIILPVNSGLYCGLYLFPIIIMFFNQSVLNKKDWFYAFLFIIILNPIQIPIWKTNLSIMLINCAILLLAFDIMLSEIIKIVRKSRQDRFIR